MERLDYKLIDPKAAEKVAAYIRPTQREGEG